MRFFFVSMPIINFCYQPYRSISEHSSPYRLLDDLTDTNSVLTSYRPNSRIVPARASCAPATTTGSYLSWKYIRVPCPAGRFLIPMLAMRLRLSELIQRHSTYSSAYRREAVCVQLLWEGVYPERRYAET